jgi:hypothetical protein
MPEPRTPDDIFRSLFGGPPPQTPPATDAAPGRMGFRLVDLGELLAQGMVGQVDANPNQPDQPDGEPRWLASVTYRHEDGHRTKTYPLDELDDIADIVERGPHWDTVAAISIQRINHVNGIGLTVEQAAQL